VEIFKLIDVTADVGIECKGSTIKELFNAALSGLYYIIFDSVIDVNKLQYNSTDILKTAEEDLEAILFSVLDEAIYMIYQKKEIIKVEVVDVETGELRYNIYECDLKIENEIKAVTLHKFKVEWSKDSNAWIASIIFDM
jgi:SHS2 domain-containing protein